MPALAFALLGGKLKIISGLAAVGVSATSIPIALTYGGKNQNSIFTKEGISPIEDSLSKTSQVINTHLTEASQKLKEEYETKGNKVPDVVSKETMGQIQGKWKDGEEVIESAYKYIYDNAKDINYYTFVLGNPVKSSILMIPKIIRDTIVHNDQTKRDQQLLSIQKIIAVSKKKGFEEFSEALTKLVLQHQKTLKDITVKDGLEVLKIFREIREDDYDLFMEQVKKNIEQMQQKNNYESATELLKDVFVGIDSIKSFEENKKKLRELIESAKEKLKEIEGLEDDEIDSFLNTIS